MTLVSELIKKVLNKGRVNPGTFAKIQQEFGKYSSNLESIIKEEFENQGGKIKKKVDLILISNNGKIESSNEINFKEIFGEEIIKKAGEIVAWSDDVFKLIYTGEYFDIIKNSIKGSDNIDKIKTEFIKVFNYIIKSKLNFLDRKYFDSDEFRFYDVNKKYLKHNISREMNVLNLKYKPAEINDRKAHMYILAKFFYEKNRILEMFDREIGKNKTNKSIKWYYRTNEKGEMEIVKPEERKEGVEYYLGWPNE